MVIDELRVISFDRFAVKLPASVQYEDQVRVYLGYMRHFLQKIKLIGFEFDMPDTSSLSLLPGQQLKLTEQEEETKAFPLEGKYEQLPPQMSPAKPLIGSKRSAEKGPEKLEASVLQYKSDGSGGRDVAIKKRKRDTKRLHKLKDFSFEGFLSCAS